MIKMQNSLTISYLGERQQAKDRRVFQSVSLGKLRASITKANVFHLPEVTQRQPKQTQRYFCLLRWSLCQIRCLQSHTFSHYVPLFRHKEKLRLCLRSPTCPLAHWEFWADLPTVFLTWAQSDIFNFTRGLAGNALENVIWGSFACSRAALPEKFVKKLASLILSVLCL